MHDPSHPTANELAGRVALITGANTGIGRVTAIELARRGAQVYLACRSHERTLPVLDEIRSVRPGSMPEWLPLELDDFESVKNCAQQFLALGQPLHLLFNNAGLAGARGLTRSGFEYGFGVNHMGHFLLTQLLLERIKESAPARIVTVSSRAHNKTDGIDWNKVRQPTSTLLGIREYAVSKLANVLFSAELGRRLIGRGVTTYSLHPGVIDSDIWRTLPGPLRVINRLRLKSPVVGAATLLHCALSDAVSSETGLYYSDCEKKLPSRAAQDGELAYALWHRSNEWVHDWLSQ